MRARRFGLLLSLVALLCFWAPQTADAHAFLSSSSPADGATVATAPHQLRLDFSETVVLAATELELVGENGRRYAVSELRIEGEGGEEPSRVLAVLPSLPEGAYRLSWQTLSADDLHRTAGVLVFGVGRPVEAAGLNEPKPAPGEAGLRWLVFLSLALALGGALMGALLRRLSNPPPGWLRMAHRSWPAGAAAGLLGSLALLGFQLRGATTGLLAGGYGVRWGLRELGFVLLLTGAIVRRSRIRTAGLVLGAASVGLGTALMGHAAATAQLSVTRVVADALHLVAAATWAGALSIGMLIAVSAVRGSRAQLPAAIAVLRSFGRPAAICISVVISTGLYLTSGVIGSVDAALATFYGRTLLLKIGLVAVIGALGVINHRRVRGPGTAFRRGTIPVEAVLAIGVLGLSATITSGQPALEPQLIRDPKAVAVPLQDARVADLQQTLAVRPNAPGRNLVMVEVFDSRRPAPAPVGTVTVGLVDTDGSTLPPVTAQRLADGRWSAPVVLSGSGSARFVVTVRRAGLPEQAHTYDWVVAGAPAVTWTEIVSTKPVRNELLVLWLAVTVLIVAGWWVVARPRTGSAAVVVPRLVTEPGAGQNIAHEARRPESLSR
ncbi:copper resistance protein CopC [Kribbella sp. NPDC005582]|uniref:copper resistance CopC/CopD family protein n=1 Tax=Kribbella sp. NPDC005582 TaxID=3156893 RepID=UPI0033ABDC0E